MKISKSSLLVANRPTKETLFLNLTVNVRFERYIMKIFLFGFTILFSTQFASAAPHALTCWPSFKMLKPAITAVAVDKTTLTKVVLQDYMNSGAEPLTLSQGPIVGRVNPKARKYIGYLYFNYSGRAHGGDAFKGSIILPPDFATISGPFQGYDVSSSGDAGGTLRMTCATSELL